MRRTALLTTLVVSLLVPVAAQAETRKVNPGGTDAGNCVAAACKTIDFAVGVAGQGDTIQIAAGTYAEGVDMATKRLHLVGSGPSTSIEAPSAPYTAGITAYKGGSISNLRVVGSSSLAMTGAPAISSSATGGPAKLTISNVVAQGGESITMQGGAALTIIGGSDPIDVDVAGSDFSSGDGNFGGATVAPSADQGTANISKTVIKGSPLLGTALEQSGSYTTNLSEVLLTGSQGLFVREGTARLRRSTVFASGQYGVEVLSQAGNISKAEVTNSTVTATGAGPSPVTNAAVHVQTVVGAGSAGVTATGSTFIANGTAYDAAVALQTSAGAPVATADLRNTIARAGGAQDLLTDRGKITAARSSFSTSSATAGGTVPAPASADNIAGNPGLDGSGPKLAASSPLIDRGNAAFVTAGELDRDGNPRSLDGNGDCVAAPDIGAFERPAVVGKCANVAPVLSKLSLLRKKFTAKKPRSKKRKKGTTIRFTLSEAAKVAIKVEQRTTGRRSGKKCVKRTRRNAKRNKCTRYVSKGSLKTFSGKAGANSVKFSGKVGRKTLKPGSYRFTLVATDAAGAKSAAKRLAFRVLAP